MHTAYLATPTLDRAVALSRLVIPDTAGLARDSRRRLLRALAGRADTSPIHRPPHQRPRDRSSAQHRHGQADQPCEHRPG